MVFTVSVVTVYDYRYRQQASNGHEKQGVLELLLAAVMAAEGWHAGQTEGAGTSHCCMGCDSAVGSAARDPAGLPGLDTMGYELKQSRSQLG